MKLHEDPVLVRKVAEALLDDTNPKARLDLVAAKFLLVTVDMHLDEIHMVVVNANPPGW